MVGLRRVPERLGGAPDRVAAPPKVALPFYHSPAWVGLVRALKAQRGASCQVCGRGGRIFADHIVELKDGGALLDPGNVQLLCGRCHGIKTEREKAKRVGLVTVPAKG